MNPVQIFVDAIQQEGEKLGAIVLRHSLELLQVLYHRVAVLNKFVEKIGHVDRLVLHPQVVDESSIGPGDFPLVTQHIAHVEFLLEGLAEEVAGEILRMGETLHGRVEVTGQPQVEKTSESLARVRLQLEG